MFSNLSSSISEQPQGQKGPWLHVRALLLPFVLKVEQV